MISSPPGTEMFQFPDLPPHRLWIQRWVSRHHPGGVAPFGHPRIKACWRLPEAFRSQPRPSSAPGAKASTVRPQQLDHKNEDARIHCAILNQHQTRTVLSAAASTQHGPGSHHRRGFTSETHHRWLSQDPTGCLHALQQPHQPRSTPRRAVLAAGRCRRELRQCLRL